MSFPTQTETVPVRIYHIDDRIMVAAPLPGLEPADIRVSIAGTCVTIDGKERGPHQHERDLLVAEWTIGPYHREVILPQPVDGALANATYGNGVLVLALPKLALGQPTVPTEFRLQAVGETTHGEWVGHSGSTIVPTTTEDHQQKHRAENGHGNSHSSSDQEQGKH
jgi:HSP20 family protein